jgi:hypothetical protein
MEALARQSRSTTLDAGKVRPMLSNSESLQKFSTV